MEYEKHSIVNVIKQINREIYLPSIQRKFVWDCEQIENLMESIMLQYPIGTFLFWEIEKGSDPSTIDKNTFYKFISNYNEKEAESGAFLQERLDKPSMIEKLTAVLDGQQRLSALYCVINGSYAFKTRKKSAPAGNLYPKRDLYINVLHQKKEDNEKQYSFKFLISADSNEVGNGEFWIKVKDVVGITQDPENKRAVMRKIKEYQDEIRKKFIGTLFEAEIVNDERLYSVDETLNLLWEQLVKNQIIMVFKVKKEKLDDILDIFVRVNSAGTELSKSDLLFSTVVAHWEEGREEIEQLLKDINTKGEKFNFDNDFIFSACLALLDLPQEFKVSTFDNHDNIERVKNNWTKITLAIKASIDLLVEFGINKEILTATYIVIPIAYFFYKSAKDRTTISPECKNNMRLFILYSMLKKIFSLSTNDVVAKLIRELKEPIFSKENKIIGYKLKQEEVFDLKSLGEIDFQSRYLKMEKSDIEEILSTKKGPISFMILSLLYPNIRYDTVKWHQDHIHPISFFKKGSKNAFPHLTDDELKKMREKADKISNLQLLEGVLNQSKSNKKLSDWIEDITVVPDKVKYFADNYISETADLSIEAFELFFEMRKKILFDKLSELLIDPAETDEE